MLHKESIQYAWESPEFDFQEKDKRWYWLLGVGALLLIALAVYFQNYLFAFLILIGGFLMFRLSNQQPPILSIELSDQGVQINDELFDYENIIAFWIGSNTKGEPILLLATNKAITPILSIRIHPNIDLMEMREYLLEFVEEQKMKEPFTNQFIEKIGF